MEAAESRPDWTREVAALRRVARALLADEHAADDVLQEAWLRAHARQAAPKRPAAYWKRVVANLARDRRRGEARRAERERHVARPEALPSTDDVAARLELVQRVARAAAELPEPYRSTIHLHYFEDQSAAEIAARAGVAIETVRTRIRRGLERMRASLDDSAGGDRAAWSLILAPIALRRASEPTLAAGAALITAAGGTFAVGKLLIVAAGTLVAVAALWFVSRGAPATPPLVPAQPLSVSNAARDASVARSESTRALEVETDLRAALTVEAAPSAITDGLIDLAGTFTLSAESGASQSDVDGYFFLERTAADGRSEDGLVQVEGGRWSARAALGESLTFRQAYAAGHPARLSSEPVPVPHDGRAALEAKAWPRTRLRVVESSTGLDLQQIELRWGTTMYMPVAQRHPGEPGEWDVQRTGLSSPFEVELPSAMLEDSTLRVWVSAPGLAWNHVDVLPSAGGTRTVALVAGGDLEVYPSGRRPDRNWLICLVEIRGEPRNLEQFVAWQIAAEGEVTRLERLAPGRYSVHPMLGVGKPGLGGASEEFEIRAGEVTRVSLQIEHPEAAPRVHLRGTLIWPEGTTVSEIAIEPRSRANPQQCVRLPTPDMTPDPERPRTLHWDAGEILAGEYLALNWSAGLRQRFDTGTGPVFHLDLALPPRGQVVVRVLDAQDGQPVPAATVTWTLKRTDDGGYVGWTQESDPAELGFVRFEAPLVALQMEIAAPGWTSQRQDLAPEPGPASELEVRLRRETGLRVRVLEDDAVIPGFWARPRIVDPAGERVTPRDWDWNTADCRILLDPGTYRLAFDELEARWQAPEWIDVQVVEGALTPVDFPLVRAP